MGISVQAKMVCHDYSGTCSESKHSLISRAMYLHPCRQLGFNKSHLAGPLLLSTAIRAFLS